MQTPFFKTAMLLLLIAGSPICAFSQKVTAVTGVSITVGNLDREIDFFVKNLDFKKIKTEKLTGKSAAALFGLGDKKIAVEIVTLQLGQEQIRLLHFEGTRPARPVPSDTRSNDLWFQHLAIVVSNMDTAYQKLLKNKVQHVSTFPETLPDYLPNAAGIKAFYFRDPEGHNLELIWFPPGKGAPKWQAAPNAPTFLGIDHTAIAISDTDNSLVFYRDLLGLVVGGHSENYGTEQEHLNQMFGARLDINGLHAEMGFGVEFLRYIAPPGGRTIPPDSQPTDLWHYQTEFLVDDMPGLLQKLGKLGMSKISTSVTEVDDAQTLLVRDPDGHAVLFRTAPMHIRP
ncbi:MAG: VOC family protein [Bacteroidota bacterium]